MRPAANALSTTASALKACSLTDRTARSRVSRSWPTGSSPGAWSRRLSPGVAVKVFGPLREVRVATVVARDTRAARMTDVVDVAPATSGASVRFSHLPWIEARLAFVHTICHHLRHASIAAMPPVSLAGLSKRRYAVRTASANAGGPSGHLPP